MEAYSISISGTFVPEESVLLEKLQEAIERGSKRINIIDGVEVETNSQVKITLGPVIGEVTQFSAIILLEVTSPDTMVPLKCTLFKVDAMEDPVQILDMEATSNRPIVVKFEDLEPNQRYVVFFHGVCKYHATTRQARFKTKAEDIDSFRLVVVSCDRPSRLLLGQQDPWQLILKRNEKLDLVLHIGDQIYPDNEDIDHAANIFNAIFDDLPEAKQQTMMARCRELWRNKYRHVFSRPSKASVLARVSNLMIWSDNDVANDFTTMKTSDGEPKYHPSYLKCGMSAYREYQRRLWDPDCTPRMDGLVQEWHKHKYGPIGIFMFDLRGNRIDANGCQQSENDLISEEQWSELEDFFGDQAIRVMILCSETPFVGDEPGCIREKVETNPANDFLRDHWPYNETELIKLLDLCFAWKAEGETNGKGRELVLIGGDIHCGVTSVIRDDETSLQINHLTTSPVTNHVCKFFPPPEGQISERYSFSHLPLGEKFRNFADIEIRVEEDDVNVQAKLVPVSTDIFKDSAWQDLEDD